MRAPETALVPLPLTIMFTLCGDQYKFLANLMGRVIPLRISLCAVIATSAMESNDFMAEYVSTWLQRGWNGHRPRIVAAGKLIGAPCPWCSCFGKTNLIKLCKL
jgi:hypothetical protein